MDQYELMKQVKLAKNTIYYIRNTKYNTPDEIDLTLATDPDGNLLVWGDAGANCWYIVTHQKFYTDIARQLKILA